MRVLVFTPPFHGHANVLVALAKRYAHEHDFTFVVTGWSNVRTELGVEATYLNAGPLAQTDPALWTLPRAAELLPACVVLAEETRPDAILYDFFSVEGALTAKVLGIPAWGSIPALLGPFQNRDYLEAKLGTEANRRALERIHALSGLALTPADFEMVSDGIHFPGDIDLVWSYRGVVPNDHGRGRRSTPRIFVGNPTIPNPRRPRAPTVLVSFGTVVMDNLWNQQPETRPRIRALISDLAERWRGAPFNVLFVTQGKTVLDAYPANWTVQTRVDQARVLGEVSAFVTHAGSNSFHEALVRHVPMVAVPFFGDQSLVAATIEQLGVGINVSSGTPFDTKDAASVLDDGLAGRVDAAIQDILANRARFDEALARIDTRATDPGALLSGKIPFEEGDLLYGTNVARVDYVKKTRSEDEFQIMKFVPFSSLAPHPGALPRIVDIYHDAMHDEAVFRTEVECGIQPYAETMRRYREHLGDEKDICQMCLRGLDFFTQQHRVHFLLDAYNPAVNYITTKEIEYVLANRDRFDSRVIFYKGMAGTWVPLTFDEVHSLLTGEVARESGREAR
jgi:UDP:flavonoid glycosyltransferase YjiC (YdhE family)